VVNLDDCFLRSIKKAIMTSIKARELLMAIESCTDLSGPRSNLDKLQKCIEKCIKEGWDKNADVLWTGKNGRKHLYPLIHWAAVLGKCNALEWLLKRGFSPLAKSSGTGETALHRAVHMPLIERKPRQNVNRLIEKFPRTVKLLNEALPIKNKKDGGTPLHRATYLLVNEDCKANLRFFVTCCKEIANEGKKMGYDSDAILNSVNDSGETALHILARCEKDKVVYCTQAIKALSAAGAKGNIYNDKGYTALDIAVDLGSDPIIKELLKTIPVVKVDDPAEPESLCEPGCSGLVSHPPSILDKLFDADVAASAETSCYEDKDNGEEDTYCPRDAHAQPSKETLEDRGDPCQVCLSAFRLVRLLCLCFVSSSHLMGERGLINNKMHKFKTTRSQFLIATHVKWQYASVSSVCYLLEQIEMCGLP